MQDFSTLTEIWCRPCTGGFRICWEGSETSPRLGFRLGVPLRVGCPRAPGSQLTPTATPINHTDLSAVKQTVALATVYVTQG